MSRALDYRQHAKEARDYAEHLTSASDKAMWRVIAEEWERMAASAETAEAHPDAQLAQQPGVGCDKSDAT